MRHNYQLKIFALTVASLSALSAYAVPAKKGILPITQPDGTTVMVRLVGDEYSHQYYTEDGYLLVHDGNALCYARIGNDGLPVSTGTEARDITVRSAAEKALVASIDKDLLGEAANRLDAINRRNSRKVMSQPLRNRVQRSQSEESTSRLPGLFPGTNFPSFGQPKVLVILAEFKDQSFKTPDPAGYFERLLNYEGFDEYGATGSVLDYFKDNSNGKFNPQFDLFGPVVLPEKTEFYGGNNFWGDDKNPEQMVIDACTLLDDEIDFSQYDTDGDGIIDNVFIFYAGRGEASSGITYTIWPHSWNIYEGAGKTVYLDNVLLDRYACSNEWDGVKPDGIGTFVHEFSHVLGLPDLYATRDDGAFTPESWSIMDYGPYNNDGRTPPLYSAFERSALGWIEPLPIDTALNATLPPISEGKAGIIRTPKDNEFFLFENRQQKGWDKYIPGHGMLVWHIDYNESVWASNVVNNTPSHQYVDLEEADNVQSDYTRASDAFPGARNVTSFTDDTNPSMKTWAKQRLNLPVTDIKESADGIITFKVSGGTEELHPVTALEATEVSLQEFTANWEPKENFDHLLSVFTLDEDSLITYVDGFYHRNVGKTDSYKVEGLLPCSEYFYTVTYGTAWETAPESNTIAVITSGSDLWRHQVNILEPAAVSDSSFVARWEFLEGATDYILTVKVKGEPVPYVTELGFDDGVTDLPDGWTSSSKTAYKMETYSGKSSPSLRLGKYNDYIESAEFDDFISAASFWLRGNATTGTDSIKVSALSDSVWNDLCLAPITTERGGNTVELTDFPENTTAIRLNFIRNSGSGTVAIDDIVIYHGEKENILSVENYTDLSVGNVNEYEVTGLSENSEYYYSVVASDGEVMSKKSDIMTVITIGTNSITDTDIDASNANIEINGLEVTLSGMESGQPVRVFDSMGRLIALPTADLSGNIRFSLPASGIYLIRTGSETTRVAVAE